MFQRVTIGSLPDNVLVEIFDFYRAIIKDKRRWDWKTLVHVCQRWRYVVFESPIRLDLQLFCTNKTPLKKLLDVWPASLPIAIEFSGIDGPDHGVVNIVAALERRDRIRQIHFTNRVGCPWEEILTAMQGPFPALRDLYFDPPGEMLTLPDTFLNGSAPCLQHLHLWKISFPSLPQFLLSTRDLISLEMPHIPKSWYISPVTMATSLSALPKLETLSICFGYPTRHPERRNRPPPPPTRFVLPALDSLHFRGSIEYLEVLAARIDAPILDWVRMSFFYEPIFDIPQTIRFVGHLICPRPTSLVLKFNLPFDLSIQCREWKVSGQWFDVRAPVSSVAHICSQILRHEMDFTLWSQLFHSLDYVYSLDISPSLEPIIIAALQGLTEESAAELFPSLDSRSIVGKLDSLSIVEKSSDEAVQQDIQSFLAVRQHSSLPMIISRREGD
jgi:F-box-like